MQTSKWLADLIKTVAGKLFRRLMKHDDTRRRRQHATLQLNCVSHLEVCTVVYSNSMFVAVVHVHARKSELHIQLLQTR